MKKSIGIIGGGILGLTTAYVFSTAMTDVQLTIVEKEKDVGEHQTGHNSGVVHSGIYYPPNSLKAKLTRKGREYLRVFCQEHNIPYSRCGKLIVATTEAQYPQLLRLYERGKQNGLRCELWNSHQIRMREPHCIAQRAVWVPETAVTDFTAIAKKLRSILESRNVHILTNTVFHRAEFRRGKILVRTSHRDFEFDYLINCGGLYADKIAQQCGVTVSGKILPFRGEYYSICEEKSSVCRGLIYPVPDPRLPFLGVHLTRTIHGEVKCGPTALLVLAREGYTWADCDIRDLYDILTYRGTWFLIGRFFRTGVQELYRSFSKSAFYRSVTRLITGIEREDLLRNGSGVRAQFVFPDGKLADDFILRAEKNMLHIFNAPSPAATASFAIAEYIYRTFQKHYPDFSALSSSA